MVRFTKVKRERRDVAEEHGGQARGDPPHDPRQEVVCVFRYKEEARRAAISATRWIGTNTQ